MGNIEAIIFDYDGIIAESVNVKTKAFAEIFKPYGEEIVKKVIEHHEVNGGMSRFEKFKIYFKEYLGQEIDQRKVDILTAQFSRLVLQKVIDSPFVNGSYEFISSNYLNFAFYICTGTPTSEMEIILERKDLRKYFKGVYGSPEKKDNHVRNILNANNYKKNQVVFIGDALSDRDAAKSNGITFIARYTTSKALLNEKFVIKGLNELNNIIKSL